MVNNKINKSKKNRLSLYNRKNLLNKQLRFNFNKKKMYIYIPTIWNILIFSLQNNTNNFLIYLFNKTYYFTIPILNKTININYDTNSKSLILKSTYSNIFYKTYWNLLQNTLYSFSLIFFKKLKFKGKGYYIFKNFRNTITPQFGHSHRIYMYSYFVSVKFLSKTSIFLFGFTTNDLLTAGYNIKKSKNINIFTGRGVRFSKQVIYKKTGKVSTYR